MAFYSFSSSAGVKSPVGTSLVPTLESATEPIHRTISRDALCVLCAFQHLIYSFNLKSVLPFLIIEAMPEVYLRFNDGLI